MREYIIIQRGDRKQVSKVLGGIEGTYLENINIDELEIKNWCYACAANAGVTGMPDNDGLLVMLYIPYVFAIRLYFPHVISRPVYRSTKILWTQSN